VRAFRALQERDGIDRPRVSAWLTGLKETIVELPAFVQVAAEIGVKGDLSPASRLLRERVDRRARRTRACTSG
jgi:hypothetical protein